MKRNPAIHAAPVIALAMALGSSAVHADGGLSAAGSKEWTYTLTPYLWMVGMNGDMTVQGTKTEVDEHFSDLLSNLDFAIEAHAEAWKGNWGLFVDGSYVNLGVEGQSGPVDVNVDSRFYQFEAGGLYRAVTWQIGDGGNREAGLELLAGARYTNLKVEISPRQAPAELRDHKGWTDLIVGARLTADLATDWSVILRGDIGGFGISGNQDMALNGSLLFGWRFRPDWNLLLGYRALHQDYQDGKGADEFRYKVTTHGPMLGVEIAF